MDHGQPNGQILAGNIMALLHRSYEDDYNVGNEQTSDRPRSTINEASRKLRAVTSSCACAAAAAAGAVATACSGSMS